MDIFTQVSPEITLEWAVFKTIIQPEGPNTLPSLQRQITYPQMFLAYSENAAHLFSSAAETRALETVSLLRAATGTSDGDAFL